MISLIVFLGNYGKQYTFNRHNVAWQFADSISLLTNSSWHKKFKGSYCIDISGTFGTTEHPVYFLKPETFMNLSGESIIELSKFYKIKPEEILVIHDELELPLGTISLKWAGGLGGHNGLRSTKACLDTADFWRLRFGIGRPNHDDIAGYVLSDFSKDEQILLSQAFMKAEQLLNKITFEKPEKLLDEWKKVNVN